MCFWQEWFNACLVSGFTGIQNTRSTDGRRRQTADGTRCASASSESIDEAKANHN
jgi:hypothetical protein